MCKQGWGNGNVVKVFFLFGDENAFLKKSLIVG